MRVVIITECNHGLIGVTENNPETVIDFLIENQWLSGASSFYNEKGECWTSILEALGKTWEQFLKSRTISQLNEIFTDNFIFHEEEVYTQW